MKLIEWFCYALILLALILAGIALASMLPGVTAAAAESCQVSTGFPQKYVATWRCPYEGQFVVGTDVTGIICAQPRVVCQ